VKKVKLFIITILLIAILIGCSTKKPIYTDGVYEGIGQGHHGPIKVKVIVEEKKIKRIQIIEQQETPYLCDIVYEKLPKRIIKANSTDVDVVAGATFTSNGLIEAVNNALEGARIEEEE
jgi:uncharacterized protein with FMN-binding domain